MLNFLFNLQTARETWGKPLTMVLLPISEFAVEGTVLCIAIIYLCIDKRLGKRLFWGFGLCNVANEFLKLCLCIYRPWILDSRLHVDALAESGATGYSCPSGHTTSATNFYGNIAVWYRKYIWPVIVCSILILLTAFARMWLGAHTPLDVTLAILETLCMIGITNIICNYLDEHPNREVFFLIVIAVLVLTAICIVEFKSYPLDYAADGSLIVDPESMKTAFFKSAGLLIGSVLGFVLERRYSEYKVPDELKSKIITGIMGVISYGAVYYGLHILKSFMPEKAAVFAYAFCGFLWITGIYPIIYSKLQTIRKNRYKE